MTLFSLTPISQKPEKDGIYRRVDNADMAFSFLDQFKDGKWNDNSQLRPFWLRPIPEEELRKLIGDGFDGYGQDILKSIGQAFSNPVNQSRVDKESHKRVFQALGAMIEKFPLPDKETYINNFLNQQP